MQPIDTPYLFELEKKIIAKYRTFRNIDPKPIKIVENSDFDGRADEDSILVSIMFLRKNPKVEEIEKLLKHELCHYVCQDEGTAKHKHMVTQLFIWIFFPLFLESNGVGL